MFEQESQFKCPQCGAWSTEDTLIKRDDPDFVETDFGLAMIWREYHECAQCGWLWSFINSDR